MNIIIIADIHSQIDQLSLVEADIIASDLVLLTGDITNFGHRPEAERILARIEELAPAILAVPGNCDYPEVEAVLTERNYNLDGRAVVKQDLGFIGLGGSLPAPGGTPNEYSEAELGDRLTQAAEAIDQSKPFVLVSHQPPFDTSTDLVRPGLHVGSQRVRQFIEQYAPVACLTGHIHEGVGIDHIDKCIILNPGPLRGGVYGYLKFENQKLTAELRSAKSG